jgi:hypothetical protein
LGKDHIYRCEGLSTATAKEMRPDAKRHPTTDPAKTPASCEAGVADRADRVGRGAPISIVSA